MELTKGNKILILFVVSIFVVTNLYLGMLEGGALYYAGKNIFIINCLFFIAVLYFVAIYLIKCVYRNKEKPQIETLAKFDNNDLTFFIIVSLIQFLFWMIPFMAYFPGLFNYDVHYQIPQSLGSYSTHHPLIHTLYLQFFYYIVGEKLCGSYNAGVMFATLVQMIIFSCMISYTHLFLRKVRMKKVLLVGAVAFFCVTPTVSLLAIALTKDTFFSGFIGILVSCLGYYHYDPELFKSSHVRHVYILALIGVILFRNNGIYPVMALVIYFTYKQIRGGEKDLVKGIWVRSICGLMLGLIISACLKIGLQAAPGEINEALSIPYQQISCAYVDHKEALSKEDKEEINYIIPAVDNYDPYFADPVKGTARGGEHKKQLTSLWLRIGIRYPKSYVKAVIKLDAGYLYLLDTTFTQFYQSLGLERQGALLTDTKEGFGVIHRSLLPKAENIYEKLFTENKYRYVIGLNVLITPAIYFWAAVFLIMVAVVFKQKRFLPIGIFVSVLLATIIAGPCALPRYILPIILCIPQMFAVTIRQNKECR